MFDYEVKIAQDKKEIEEALILRYEIFTQEMGGHLDQGGLQQLDEDKYDKFCDHLIVIDKAGNKIVGTYRLLLGQKANKIGFYSERFFNIENIKKLAGDKEMLELGRSCIHRDYRDRLVINLLWNGISKYIKEQNVRFAFGSVRLGSAEPLEVSRMFKLIKEKFYAPEEYRVFPKRKNIVKGLNMNIKIRDPRSIWRTLPALVKGYLRTGVVVCGPPAVNPDFGSVVVFVLLDVDKMSPSYKRHFF